MRFYRLGYFFYLISVSEIYQYIGYLVLRFCTLLWRFMLSYRVSTYSSAWPCGTTAQDFRFFYISHVCFLAASHFHQLWYVIYISGCLCVHFAYRACRINFARSREVRLDFQLSWYCVCQSFWRTGMYDSGNFEKNLMTSICFPHIPNPPVMFQLSICISNCVVLVDCIEFNRSSKWRLPVDLSFAEARVRCILAMFYATVHAPS